MIPQPTGPRARVSCATVVRVKRTTSAAKEGGSEHVDDCEVLFFYFCITIIYLPAVRVVEVGGGWIKSMVLLCASPGPRRSPRTRSVYCAQKKGNYNVNVSQRGSEPSAQDARG